VADAHTRDVVQIEGVWVIKIHTKNRSRDQRLKTVVSIRDVPLHSALLDEAFLEYVVSVGDGPLFPQLRLDGYGRRSGQASTEISEWLRKVVKITDPAKSWYSHRHTATSYLRNTLGPDGTPKVKVSNSISWDMAARVVRARMAAMASGGTRPSERRSK